MGTVLHEFDRGTRIVAGVEVRTTELVWDDGGRGYEVYRLSAELLTVEASFDRVPSDEQIAALLDRHQHTSRWWACRGCGRRIQAGRADRIVDHVLRGCDALAGATQPDPHPALTARPQPAIRRILAVSTAHLPRELGIPGGLDTVPGVIAHATGAGFLLWVPDDPDESAHAITDPVPGPVLAVQRYARVTGCDYVLFDADADQIDDLPTWDW